MLQLHYTTSGRETTDASEIALYLWDEEPERQVLGGSAAAVKPPASDSVAFAPPAAAVGPIQIEPRAAAAPCPGLAAAASLRA